MSEHLDYVATQVRNRKIFSRNFSREFKTFDSLLTALRSVWARLGNERDASGRSNIGLLPFVNILVRHSIFGFEHIVSYQSFLTWLTFRPGLEALLILGKLVDDPGNAEVWKDRQTNRKAYMKTFQGRELASVALPRSADFLGVLRQINDNFVHPNPDFLYRDATVRPQGANVLIEIPFFDTRKEIHEAHLLAYLNIIDLVVFSSEALVSELLEPNSGGSTKRQSYAEREASRAEKLAKSDTLAEKIMEEIGLWKIKSTTT